MKPIYYISIGLLVVLLTIATVSTCSTKKSEKIITETELKTALIKQEQQLKTAFLKVELSKIDSLKKVETLNTEAARLEVNKHAALAKLYLKKANALQAKFDSLKTVGSPCDEQLDTCEQINKELIKVINENDTTIESLGKEAESYSNRLYLAEQQNFSYYVTLIETDKRINDLANENIVLIADLKRKNNWFNRNKIWLGLGVGFFSGIIIK